MFPFCRLSVLGANSKLRQLFLKPASAQDCRTLQLGDSWISHSLIACQLECMDRYSENCQAVVYNSETGICRPGSTAFWHLQRVATSIPKIGSADTLYYVRQPIPPCNTENNFAVYDVCGTSACIYLSTSNASGYIDGRTRCSQMSSRLFVGNTIAKFSLFMYAVETDIRFGTYIGLQDFDVEGNFLWENGESLSLEQHQYVWSPGETKSNNEIENCAIGYLAGSVNGFGLDDGNCNNRRRYICERCQQC